MFIRIDTLTSLVINYVLILQKLRRLKVAWIVQIEVLLFQILMYVCIFQVWIICSELNTYFKISDSIILQTKRITNHNLIAFLSRTSEMNSYKH